MNAYALNVISVSSQRANLKSTVSVMKTKHKPCKYCGRLTHMSFQCGLRQKPLQTYTSLKQRKPMKKIGPVTKKWLGTRKEWIKQNPGPWYCYLCQKYMETAQEMTLDHIRSRSRAPELRNELNNLAACCYSCNAKKGSRDLKELTEWGET